jgi:lipopolysaccharide transport system permease protein
VNRLMSRVQHVDADPLALPLSINRPAGRVAMPDISDLWHRRELLYFLTWRDVRVRYKQTLLGAVWAVLQPVAAMVVFTLVFGHVAGLTSHGLPYSVFVYTALVPWTFFSTAVTQAANSLVLQERILTRVYFPRLLIPVAAIGACLVDLAITMGVLGGMLVYFGIWAGWNLLLLPFFVLLAFLTASAVGVWLAAVNVRYRDVRYITPFLVQIWFFATPVAYASDVVPDKYHWLFQLNPMVGVVEGFRWAALDIEPSPSAIAVAVVTTLIGCVTALLVFGHLEATFADEV